MYRRRSREEEVDEERKKVEEEEDSPCAAIMGREREEQALPGAVSGPSSSSRAWHYLLQARYTYSRRELASEIL